MKYFWIILCHPLLLHIFYEVLMFIITRLIYGWSCYYKSEHLAMEQIWHLYLNYYFKYCRIQNQSLQVAEVHNDQFPSNLTSRIALALIELIQDNSKSENLFVHDIFRKLKLGSFIIFSRFMCIFIIYYHLKFGALNVSLFNW